MSLINLNEKPGIDLYEVNFKFKMSDEEILEVGRITRKASLLISNITNADDDFLLVTPPIFIEEENEDTD